MAAPVPNATSDRLPDGSPDESRDAVPRAVRRTVGLLLAALVAGALYLIALRRDAILIDLANFSAWCF